MRDVAEQEGTLSIGDVFARAWDLWRRDVGWLILAGLVVGVIMVVVFAIVGGIFVALMAGAGSAIGADALDNSTGGLTGLGAGIGIMGVIVYLVAMFLIQVLAHDLLRRHVRDGHRGYRQQRDVQFGDLFSGFRKFGSYAVYALVHVRHLASASASSTSCRSSARSSRFVVSIWISIIWLYVLPLIADQGLSFMEAAGKSNQMVKSAGWWWTFGMVILLGIAAIVVVVARS